MKTIDKRLNIVFNFLDEDMKNDYVEMFDNDAIALKFYLILRRKYENDEDFVFRCIDVARDVGEQGYPKSIKELKDVTDFYFKKELKKKELEILFYYLEKKEIPNGILA